MLSCCTVRWMPCTLGLGWMSPRGHHAGQEMVQLGGIPRFRQPGRWKVVVKADTNHPGPVGPSYGKAAWGARPLGANTYNHLARQSPAPWWASSVPVLCQSHQSRLRYFHSHPCVQLLSALKTTHLFFPCPSILGNVKLPALHPTWEDTRDVHVYQWDSSGIKRQASA